MINFLKKLFCRHNSIEIITESYSPEKLFIVKSIIKCKHCNKTFTNHPHANCCYVNHIHNQIMYDYWINNIKHNIQQCEEKLK